MAISERRSNNKFRLSNFVITIAESGINASEYIYYEKENIIRETSHPATIDKNEQSLIIQMNYMKGKNISLTLDEFTDFFKNLPELAMTRYYQLYDHHNNNKYINEINLLSKYSTMDIEILK
ncbi:MAG: hypothetical protein JW807_14130 [Spirochaetes bacterium]|nr:hypothetical protein [Spirochaetota bacterium]